MPSPFPGMDAYVESSGIWGDFHGSLLAAIRADLNAHLPKGYAASIELYVWAGEGDPHGDTTVAEPDIHVREGNWKRNSQPATATVTAHSTIVLPALRRRKRKFIKVVDVRTRQVVTVVEVLSPSNKKNGEDREHYLEKRYEYLANNLGFVEIDLLRGGRRPPLGNQHGALFDYYAMVCRPWEFPRVDFWTFGIRDPLPAIPVPVTDELEDTLLNLHTCVQRACEEGRYSEDLPYDEPLKPRLRSEDRNWVRTLLANRPG